MTQRQTIQSRHENALDFLIRIVYYMRMGKSRHNHLSRRYGVWLAALGALAFLAACGGSANPYVDPVQVEFGAAIHQQVRAGRITFAVPVAMEVGSHHLVKANIASGTTDRLTQGLQGVGSIYTQVINVSSNVEANVTGPDFRIQNLTPRAQGIPASGAAAQWSWNVTPLKSGSRSLYLTVDAIVYLKDGSTRSTAVRVFSRRIQVQALPFSMRDWLKGNWGWLLGVLGLLISVAAIVIPPWMSRRRALAKARETV